jgi:hypothetical protein
LRIATVDIGEKTVPIVRWNNLAENMRVLVALLDLACWHGGAD